MREPGRCIATHNPGKWPYTARCIKKADPHHEEHEDSHGKKWKAPMPLPSGQYEVTLLMDANDVNEMMDAEAKGYPVIWGDPYDDQCRWHYDVLKVEKHEPTD